MSEAQPDVTYKDTSASLVFFGVLEIILGGICALFIPLVIVSQAMVAHAGTNSSPTPPSQMTTVLFIYGLLAVVFIAVGYGSIRARRWARAIMLVLSWLWLVIGVFSTAAMSFILPTIFQSAEHQSKASPGLNALVQIISMATVFVIYVLIPLIFVLYYRSKNVQATCNQRSPADWTDRCPLPVLGLSFLLGYSALAMPLVLIGYKAVFPFFGMLLSGPLAAFLLLFSTALWAYLSWGFYHLCKNCWKIGLVVFCLYPISAIVTWTRVGFLELYRQMGMREQELVAIQRLGPSYFTIISVMTGVGALGMLAYMIYVKKYFNKAAAIGS